MARRKSEQRDDPHDEIVQYYREKLSQPAAPPWNELPWEPITLGPAWQQDGSGHYVLPELTLGWDSLAFCGTWLKHDDDTPWRFTDEQARWWLHWYAIDDQGRFLYRDAVLQRLKGWGKDPVGACLLFNEAFGPARFGGWDGDRPLAIDVPSAWVQTAAVALEQTKNTMRLFPSLITEEAQRRFRIQIGKEMVHGLGDTRLIQAVTSAPRTLEGPRATFVLLNETQHWNSSNEGHDMADVIERNATKSPDGGARTVRITNAYEPSEDSVAQRDREMFDKVEAGGAIDTGLLYDSLEAPPKAPLSAEAAPDVVKTIRGDSVWLNPERIVQSILDIRNPPSRSRRWWYNQITSSEDAVFTQQEWDACAAVLPGVPAEGDIITLGFDGSLSDDHTALIGCHVETDHLFEIAVWTPDKQTGEIDRRSVDRKVRECFELYDVVGFYADQRPFESYCDKWAEDFGRRDRATRSGLCVQAQTHQPVAWPIDRRTKLFTDAVGRFYKAIIESAKMATEGQPGDRLTHDGSRMFRLHALNARREINAWGFSLRKENRESSKKIDSMPAAVLARLARQDYLALHKSRQRRQRTGRASF